jgi:hypothetical protein
MFLESLDDWESGAVFFFTTLCYIDIFLGVWVLVFPFLAHLVFIHLNAFRRKVGHKLNGCDLGGGWI